jgi:hypothetical protein
VSSRAWDVYQDKGYGYELIDTVFYVNDYSAMEVCRSLVEHDHYPPDIVVVEQNSPDFFAEWLEGEQ